MSVHGLMVEGVTGESMLKGLYSLIQGYYRYIFDPHPDLRKAGTMLRT